MSISFLAILLFLAIAFALVAVLIGVVIAVAKSKNPGSAILVTLGAGALVLVPVVLAVVLGAFFFARPDVVPASMQVGPSDRVMVREFPISADSAPVITISSEHDAGRPVRRYGNVPENVVSSRFSTAPDFPMTRSHAHSVSRRQIVLLPAVGLILVVLIALVIGLVVAATRRQGRVALVVLLVFGLLALGPLLLIGARFVTFKNTQQAMREEAMMQRESVMEAQAMMESHSRSSEIPVELAVELAADSGESKDEGGYELEATDDVESDSSARVADEVPETATEGSVEETAKEATAEGSAEDSADATETSAAEPADDVPGSSSERASESSREGEDATEDATKDATEDATEDATQDTPVESAPAWIEAAPHRRGNVHTTTVSCGPYSTPGECNQNLDAAVRKATAEYVEWYLTQSGRSVPWTLAANPVSPPSYDPMKDQYDQERQFSYGPMITRHVRLRFDKRFRQIVDQKWKDSLMVQRLTWTGSVAAALLGMCGLSLVGLRWRRRGEAPCPH